MEQHHTMGPLGYERLTAIVYAIERLHGSLPSSQTPSPYPDIELAIEMDDWQLLQVLIDEGWPWEPTYLCDAADRGRPNVIRTLLDSRRDPDCADEHGVTALLYASAAGDDSMRSFLRGPPASQSVPIPVYKRVPVRRYVDCVELLVERGADIEQTGRAGSRPLHVAAAVGHREIVERLLRLGAARSPQDVEGRTPADRAEQGGHTSLVEAFFEDMSPQPEDPPSSA